MGARAYNLIETVMPYYKEGVVLEIGGERGEGSTAYFNNFCKKNNLKFYSVDFDPNIIISIKPLDWVIPIHTTGENFIDGFLEEKVFFAYLDNFDFIFDHIRGHQQIIDQQNRYNEFGLNMDDNNHSCYKAHLIQALLIDLDHSANPCFFLFDDTWKNGNEWGGKGALAVPYLLFKGYKIINISDHDMPPEFGFVLLGKGIE